MWALVNIEMYTVFLELLELFGTFLVHELLCDVGFGELLEHIEMYTVFLELFQM